MTRHVQPLAILQIAQGGAECMWGLIFGLSPGGMGPGSSAESWIVLSLLGLVAVPIGALRVTAGILNLAGRGRRFGLVVSNVGLLSACTCLCLPTSVALCVYAWVVYTNADVRRSFAPAQWADR